jgi:hypothetical protein
LKPIQLTDLIAAMEHKNYRVFESNHKPYNLNLVGIRAADPTPNVFNDQLWVFWRNKQSNPAWDINIYRITTDPGLYWLFNPMNPKGTGILKPGQYPGLWQIGFHNGKYEALVQAKPCTLIRDYNRDDKVDYYSGREETGLFGVNLHHAGENSVTVDKWSAGCQVFAGIREFNEFMDLARKARDFWGNSFTYTLMEEDEI